MGGAGRRARERLPVSFVVSDIRPVGLGVIARGRPFAIGAATGNLDVKHAVQRSERAYGNPSNHEGGLEDEEERNLLSFPREPECCGSDRAERHPGQRNGQGSLRQVASTLQAASLVGQYRYCQEELNDRPGQSD